MTLYEAQGTHKCCLCAVTEVLKFEACVICVSEFKSRNARVVWRVRTLCLMIAKTARLVQSVLDIKRVFQFSVQLLFKAFYFAIYALDVLRNTCRSACKVAVIFVRF
jgi:hypothetical protein